jgi:hypothetical protein
MSDPPLSIYETPALLYRSHSVGLGYSHGQRTRVHFAVTEQASVSDSGYVCPLQTEDLSLQDIAFPNFVIENSNDSTEVTMFGQSADFAETADGSDGSNHVDRQEDPGDQLYRSGYFEFDFA